VNLLAERLDLGRTPIKEAITRLQTEGVLTVVGRSGTTVNSISASEARQLFALRRMFEEFAAEDVVKNITEDELRQLRTLLEDLRTNSMGATDVVHASANFVRANVSFHSVLIASARNPFLNRFYSQTQIHAQIVTYLVFRGYDAQAAKKRQKEHEDIVAALEARDAGLLKKRLSEHAEATEALILRSLESRSTPARTAPQEAPARLRKAS
jgi:DNA-binding GntR family transcriptional regulator